MPYNGNNVIAVPGTLYAAPLGTAEPTSVTGAWPSGWITLGYTEQGSQWQIKPSVSPITPEEQYTPLRNVVTAMEYTATFNLWETTERNWNLAVNGGLLSPGTAPNVSTLGDGSGYNVNPVVIGSEVRVMIGWDSYTNGTLTGVLAGRMIMRQAFQTGTVSISRRKGANVASLALTFSAEQPNPNVPAMDIFVPIGMAS
jgi:hypothetical protein